MTSVFGVHLDIEPLAEHLGRRDQQRALVSNDVADVVRQSAVREGHVGPAIEDHDLHRLVKAPESRGTRRASGHAADNQDTASEAGGGECVGSGSASWLIGTPIEIVSASRQQARRRQMSFVRRGTADSVRGTLAYCGQASALQDG